MTPEAEERAKKEAEERVQQEEAMEPQEVQTESECPEQNENKFDSKVPESAEVSRSPDGNTGEPKQDPPPGSTTHQSPLVQNGTSSELSNSIGDKTLFL